MKNSHKYYHYNYANNYHNDKLLHYAINKKLKFFPVIVFNTEPKAIKKFFQ
jgi:hypothetical protein